MKKSLKITFVIQTILLTTVFALPVQAAINIGAPVTPSGSVVSLRSYLPASTPTSGNSVSVTTPAAPPTSPAPTTQPVPQPTPTPTPAPQPTPTPAPGPITVTTPGTSPVAGSAGSVVSLRNILNQPVASHPAPTPVTTPAPTIPPAANPVIPPVTALKADEQSMVDMINQERAAAGVKPLQVDLRLAAVARAKAQDMKDNNYFGHISPVYGSPFAMMEQVGINTHWAAENIASNNSVAGAMANFMQSIGHRANILDPNMTHVGIGIVYGSTFGNLYVQEFAQE